MLQRFLSCVAVVLCLSAPDYARTPRPVSNHAIPTTDGKSVRLTQFKGKVILFAMVLTDCADCLQTIELMGKMQKEYGPRGFQAVAAALDDDPSAATPFAQRYRPPFPFGHLDPSAAIEIGDMAKDAHPMVPVLIFIDWMGNVRFQYYGNDPMLKQPEKNIRTIADGLLRQAAEKKGPTYVTKPANQ